MTKDDIKLHHGDCLDVLQRLADEGVQAHACVTDPPYHLTSIVKRFGAKNAAPARPGKTGAYARASAGFMGQQWDGGDVAFRPETWAAIMRCLRPGAHVMAFGGTRTYHRQMVAMEDAGLEIRDTFMWLYGSGFPKSHSVSKAIDRQAGKQGGKTVSGKAVKRMIPGADQNKQGWEKNNGREYEPGEYVPATPEAAEWDGWGTAAKPAWEPIILARMPLEGTIADNVLKYGCGALNIDASRVPSINDVTGQRPYVIRGAWEQERILCNSCADRVGSSTKRETLETKVSTATKRVVQITNAKGAIVPHDMSKMDIGCFVGMKTEDTSTNLNTEGFGKMPTGQSPKGKKSTTSTETGRTTGLKTCNACGVLITPKNTPFTKPQKNAGQQMPHVPENTEPQGRWPSNVLHDGSPEVLEAFAAFGERTSGSISAGAPSGRDMVSGDVDRTRIGGRPPQPIDIVGSTGSAARFFYSAKADNADRAGTKHPTVKPLDLMRWIVRFVAPPGGLVLDPFAGSGSTLEAAYHCGNAAIGIELTEKHYQEAMQRLKTMNMVGRERIQDLGIKDWGKEGLWGKLPK